MADTEENRWAKFHLGETSEDIVVESSEDNHQLAVQLVTQANHRLDVFSRDLDPRIYDNADFINAVRSLAVSDNKARIRFLVIDPEECIDCTLCEPECPAEAIFPEDDLPEDQTDFLALNEELSQSWPVITQQKDAPLFVLRWRNVALCSVSTSAAGNGPRRRDRSPAAGSTFTTSAPKSASNLPA